MSTGDDILTQQAGTGAAAEHGTGRTLSGGLERIDGRLHGRLDLWTIIAATVVAWIVRFDQDDAYITYRIARNFARGDGLVFVPGQRVEGYTNFLWTVLLSIPERFGWPVVGFGQVLALTSFVVAVVLAYRLSYRFLPTHGQRLLALLVLCTNMTFLAYWTSGMETMLQTALLLGVANLLLPISGGAAQHWLHWASAGLLGALALLTRLDSAVLVVAIAVVAAVSGVRTATGPGGRSDQDRNQVITRAVGHVALAGFVGLVVLTPWLVWKSDYYGTITPNTYAAKAGAPLTARLMYGLLYLIAFFLSYGVFLLFPRLRDTWRSRSSLGALAPAVALSVIWCGYICWVGADFMEFRFMVPIIPYLAVIGAVVIDPITKWSRLLVISLLVISALHRVAPSPIIPVNSIAALDAAVQPDSQLGLGHDLARWFATDDPSESPVLATSTLGAISYGSDLHVVDMIGLTEPDIARNGIPAAHYYPGHVKMATIDQLLDAHVDVVLGTALPAKPDPKRKTYDVRELIPTWPVVDLGELPADARVIEIPYLGDRVLPAIELQRNPVVDAAVQREGWRTFDIDRSCRGEEPDNILVKIVSFTNGTRTCAD